MAASIGRDSMSVRLRRGIVLSVREVACEVLGDPQIRSVRYAPMFPSPRIERVLPGHLVAVAVGPGNRIEAKIAPPPRSFHRSLIHPLPS